MINLTTIQSYDHPYLVCYLYRGVAYFGGKPEVWLVGDKEVVGSHSIRTWDFLKDLEIEGLFKFDYDTSTLEYFPREEFYSIR